MPKEKTTKAKPTKTTKKAKDPNAPKKNLSSYMFFSSIKRPIIKEENPTAPFGELGKLVGAAWKAIDEEEKKIYQDMADKDKERYNKAMLAYKNRAKETGDGDAEAAEEAAEEVAEEADEDED